MHRFLRQLARATHWPAVAAVLVLSIAGIVSIWSQAPDKGARQLVYLFASIAALTVVQSVRYNVIGRYAWGLYLLSLLLVCYTLSGLPGVRKENGASAWLDLGVMTLEPSELMKISFVLVLARYLRFGGNYRTPGGLIPPFLLALAPMALIVLQPDLGMAALFVPTLLAMLFVAGAKAKHIGLILGIGLLIAPMILLGGTDVPLFGRLPRVLKPYQTARVTAMLHPDPRALAASGYQRERALTAMGVGGLTGQGWGNLSVGKSVPEWYDDMVFAVIGEQFGFIGSALVLAAYAVLFAAGIEISAGTREPFGKLLALGLVALLASQTLLNLLVVMGMFPVTGVTLPFVSYGGSSLLASYLAVGLILSVGRRPRLVIARDAFEFGDSN